MVKELNKDKSSEWRMIKKLLVIFSIILIIGWSFNKLMFISTSTACGRITNIGSSRGSKGMNYTFEIDGKRYKNSVDFYDLKKEYKSLEMIRNLNCVEVEYSNIWPVYNRVIDGRVIK